ncbi:DUF3429 domain-containing protein [Pseudoprimorskyibacter insulae]|uniref:DUF3429 domain-containing protein n=1 Tax=Pseudoprimorskyibacter insulae TaxID=1695997 RepID=A0A2R8AUI3_9RHOB|nr:DUF3429 domain-containing protein [Pseudoprimorskyibacter insulae]SPF79695.1 hypothetical protein PRI8871_01492 [Pseudoprimorskyibacter insulae]
MTPIPRPALILGLAGLLPFLWGAATQLSPDLADHSIRLLGPRFTGPYIGLFYGSVILSFMSGVLWGFATRAKGRQAAIAYTLSVIPALWAFFMTGGGPTSAATNLITGFLGLLMIDWQFWRWNLAPHWWMPLRSALTAVVVLSLAIAIL